MLHVSNTYQYQRHRAIQAIPSSIWSKINKQVLCKLIINRALNWLLTLSYCSFIHKNAMIRYSNYNLRLKDKGWNVFCPVQPASVDYKHELQFCLYNINRRDRIIPSHAICYCRSQSIITSQQDTVSYTL